MVIPPSHGASLWRTLQVLLFTAYLKQTVHESSVETYRVRYFKASELCSAAAAAAAAAICRSISIELVWLGVMTRRFILLSPLYRP